MAIARRDTQGHWMVNGNPIFVPAPNVKIEHTNVASADSGRTEDGVMHINWVRRDVKKVYLVYNAISGNEVAEMLGLMQGQEFTFTYWDNGVKTFYGYCGESNYQAYSNVHYPNEGGLYTNFSINVIEF